jgi:hypothetical protein
MNLRRRIDRLTLRGSSRSWTRPAGINPDGLAMEAHVFEHQGGWRSALVVPAKISARVWDAIAQTQQAELAARIAACEDAIAERVNTLAGDRPTS